ncbi:MAG TPA: YdcF family protein [Dyella sp.]|nr:YdcF family protein [Dyella sp.]
MSPAPSLIRSRRYLSDRDVWHAALVSMSALVLSGGLVFVGYLVHVCRIAWRTPRRPPRPMVVLVFGQRLERDQPGEDYRHRLAAALALARAALAERLLLLGGFSGGAVSEADAGLGWLRRHGLPAQVPVQLEHESTDSLENLRHARRLLAAGEPDRPLPPVALLTSRYHLARCLLLARRLGFDGQPLAAEPRLRLTPRLLRLLVLESAYLMWIDLGVRWAGLIGHGRMAARIG